MIEIQDFRNNLDKDNLNENYLEYMKIVTSIFAKSNYENEDISKFFVVSNYTFHIFDNARSKDYGNSIHYVTLILEELLGSLLGLALLPRLLVFENGLLLVFPLLR